MEMNSAERRLHELREELEKGRKQLDRLDRERQEVWQTLLRISGAIQVLEELLKDEKAVSTEAECAVNGAGHAAAGIR